MKWIDKIKEFFKAPPKPEVKWVTVSVGRRHRIVQKYVRVGKTWVPATRGTKHIRKILVIKDQK